VEYSLRIGLIQLHALNLYVLHTLAMVRLGSLGSQGLKAMDGLESHGTNIHGALITDASALTFQEPFYGCLGEFAVGHQGLRPRGELPGAHGTAQQFAMLLLACPRAMSNVACVGAVTLYTLWIRTREGNGPQDTDSTPVVPWYCSPRLPVFGFQVFLLECEKSFPQKLAYKRRDYREEIFI
jgi:hypothetical protein